MALLDPEVRAPAQRAVGRPSLHREIADLERALAAGVVGGFPARRPVPAPSVPTAAGGPRVLATDELERVRDRLAAMLAGRPAAEARARLEAMRADPAAHRGERVTQLELGELGCGTWVVRPQVGLLGRLMGWWRVKLSSGCPLPGAARAARLRLRASARVRRAVRRALARRRPVRARAARAGPGRARQPPRRAAHRPPPRLTRGAP
jgi:hypothetical protein